jgi:hypothetical protein
VGIDDEVMETVAFGRRSPSVGASPVSRDCDETGACGVGLVKMLDGRAVACSPCVY